MLKKVIFILQVLISILKYKGAFIIKNLIKLDKTLNTRHLGGYNTLHGPTTKDYAFIRSDLPIDLTEADINKLLKLGLDTVIDLRTPKEAMSKICTFKNIKDVNYYLLPVVMDDLGFGFTESSTYDMGGMYINFAEQKKENFKEIFTAIINSNGPVLFHCSIGKDRTGVISCLLLMLADAFEYDIIENYAISEVLLKPKLEPLIKVLAVTIGDESVAQKMLSSKPIYIEKFIEHIKENYGSAKEYLINIGLSEDDIIKIKNKLINI